MDKFEYATVSVSARFESGNEGSEDGKVVVRISTFESDGKVSGVEQTEEVVIGDPFVEVFAFGHILKDIPDKGIGYLMPYMSKMGAQGWEVVEYKVSSSYPRFAQALLKRKIPTVE